MPLGVARPWKLFPSAGGVQGWVGANREDPPRRLRLLPLPGGDFHQRALLITIVLLTELADIW